MRCPFKYLRVAPQCCLEVGHTGPHMYRCSSPACPGYTYPSFQMPHPLNCLIGAQLVQVFNGQPAPERKVMNYPIPWSDDPEDDSGAF